VGDAAFQQKCLGRIADFQQAGVTIVFVSHAASAVQNVCNRAIWLSSGLCMMDGEPEEVLEAYNRGLSESGEGGGKVEVESLDWRGARILEVRCVDSEGRPQDRFLAAQPLAVEIDYEVVDRVDPVVNVGFSTIDGAFIAGIDNRMAAEDVDLPPGRRTVRFAIDTLPLMEGRFTLTVSLASADGLVGFHEVRRCVAFTVFAQGQGFGPVALPGRWSMSTESAPLSETNAST
jgi:Wzt C-terminal domain